MQRMFSSTASLVFLGAGSLTRHGSERQYKFRFGGHKYLKSDEWELVDREIQSRALRGKETVVCFNGERLAPERVDRGISLSRKKALGPAPDGRVKKRKPNRKPHSRPSCLAMTLLTHEFLRSERTHAGCRPSQAYLSNAVPSTHHEPAAPNAHHEPAAGDIQLSAQPAWATS